MVQKKARPRKPVVFGRKKASSSGQVQDNTLDMLLHYAQAGMENAELSLIETPDLFTAEEKAALAHNKNMLEQAPYLIDSYKSKINEYDALHKKMLGILQKCEEIVSIGDKQAKDEINDVLKKAKVFKYNDQGDLVIKKGVS